MISIVFLCLEDSGGYVSWSSAKYSLFTRTGTLVESVLCRVVLKDRRVS